MPEYVEVVTKVPLWASIPKADRLTVAEVKRRHPPSTAPTVDGKAMPWWVDRLIERLQNPRCECAVRSTEYGNKWLPCGQETAEGSTRCKRHGGPSVTPKKQSALKDENERLAAEVERLRALLDEKEEPCSRTSPTP